jgi:hypothetical protein
MKEKTLFYKFGVVSIVLKGKAHFKNLDKNF